MHWSSGKAVVTSVEARSVVAEQWRSSRATVVARQGGDRAAAVRYAIWQRAELLAVARGGAERRCWRVMEVVRLAELVEVACVSADAG
ncbi:hypothetical protein JCGZ_22223 [Jatropha curcas]|uniref:Uncharacterized protein n=1 Tax=Jatropha curcas TaxID=180498 RepID=A0A067JQE7_JATCU|nr:hypothetical protein JCGZ_22223 [Jatropha curcas]